MLRAVIDPGVLISALLSAAGTPAQILIAWREGRFESIASPFLLDELAAVLARPKFKAYVMPVEVDAYVEMLRREAILESDPPSEPGLTPDPGDDYLVSLARAAEADVLVSDHRLRLPFAH